MKLVKYGAAFAEATSGEVGVQALQLRAAAGEAPEPLALLALVPGSEIEVVANFETDGGRKKTVNKGQIGKLFAVDKHQNLIKIWFPEDPEDECMEFGWIFTHDVQQDKFQNLSPREKDLEKRIVPEGAHGGGQTKTLAEFLSDNNSERQVQTSTVRKRLIVKWLEFKKPNDQSDTSPSRNTTYDGHWVQIHDLTKHDRFKVKYSSRPELKDDRNRLSFNGEYGIIQRVISLGQGLIVAPDWQRQLGVTHTFGEQFVIVVSVEVEGAEALVLASPQNVRRPLLSWDEILRNASPVAPPSASCPPPPPAPSLFGTGGRTTS